MKKLIFILAVFALSGCGYKFNGASTDGLKTVRVEFFENNAPLVVPTLSQQFTEDLKERIRTQSRLSITQNDADVVFTGRITGYDIKPIAIQDNAAPVAGANRLTITVSVKYTNNTEFKGSKSFEQSFTAFEDFSLAGQSLESQQQRLIKAVNLKLTENIFNQAFAQW
ncbi:MAG: hypothetical protein EOP00_14915 [Pedobacter sp.]|nr:MAG: hypothetical protein EOP00_14915 [Pedobacter sp.]